MGKNKRLPKFVTIGPFKVELVCAPHEIIYEMGEAQGMFVQKPPYKIYLDKEMIEEGGADAFNVVVHECMMISSNCSPVAKARLGPSVTGHRTTLAAGQIVTCPFGK